MFFLITTPCPVVGHVPGPGHGPKLVAVLCPDPGPVIFLVPALVLVPVPVSSIFWSWPLHHSRKQKFGPVTQWSLRLWPESYIIYTQLACTSRRLTGLLIPSVRLIPLTWFVECIHTNTYSQIQTNKKYWELWSLLPIWLGGGGGSIDE